MNDPLETARLFLRSSTPAQAFAKIERYRADISPAWIEKVQAATGPDPWVLGFEVLDRKTMAVVGTAGFKGAAGPDGIVEIAYGINPECQNQGYATEVAAALTAFAFADPRVRLVCAHTLPAEGPSPRVLDKCGFARVGDVIDPEDGPVWRFEKTRAMA